MFEIPKGLPQNSLATDDVINIEMNDTDIDRMMSKILERAVKRGRASGTSKVDTRNYLGYLEKLQLSEYVHGAGGSRGLEVLDGWVRSSVLVQERAGLRRDSVQMGYLRPLTIAAYRSGLPKSGSRNRRADVLVYKALAHVVKLQGSTNESAAIADLFLATFGRGVELGPFPSTNPTYDSKTNLDIDTLLALRFIEQFEGSESISKEQVELDAPVPSAVVPMGHDIVNFLTFYGPLLPVAESFTHVSALIALRLFQLPLVTAHVLHGMLDGKTPADGGINPSEQYCDFVRQRGHASDELSRMSVQRDLEIWRTFFGDRLLMRSVSEATTLLPAAPVLGSTAEERLQSLAALRDDPMIQMALHMQINSIYAGLDINSDGRAYIDELRTAGNLSASDQLRAILVEGLRKRGLENQVKWFHSTGAIKKNYGILRGDQRARSTWRYAMSDECLVALLCAIFVDEDGRHTSGQLPIREVLRRFEHRFGILIATPPSGLDSADARAGAAANLDAFTQRMKLLGCYEGLSDDFSAQFVTRPREAAK